MYLMISDNVIMRRGTPFSSTTKTFPTFSMTNVFIISASVVVSSQVKSVVCAVGKRITRSEITARVAERTIFRISALPSTPSSAPLSSTSAIAVTFSCSIFLNTSIVGAL